MDEITSLRRTSGAALCLECGKCSTMCPLAASEGFSAARLIALRDPGYEIGGRSPAVQRCLTCAACELRCPQGVRFTGFVRGLREHFPAAVPDPCPHGAALRSLARLMAGPEPPRRDSGWLGEELRVAEEGEIGLFVGCLPFFDALFGRDPGVRTLEIARAAVRLLNRLGIEPVLVEDERCCGHDLLWSGEQGSFDALARANAESFRARGIQKIVTACAECCSTWRLDYPRVVPDYRPKVEHLAEFLAARLDRKELAFGDLDGATLTFQDPCRLGRHLGVFDAPRRVLGALPGARVVEMDRSGQDAVCCGTSGFIHCDRSSRRLQAERLASAARTGADRLVTACPKCLIHFACAQSEDRRRQQPAAELEVQDLTVLAASLLSERREGDGRSHPERPSQGGGP